MSKKIMIQGTGSSVGKTTLVAALCRFFSNDNKKVCPFKSQNMALNSFVDIDGLEMSRATVVQAEAAREIPRAYMNPILLKPNSDNNSQLIINGKFFKNVSAKEYFSMTKNLKEKIKNIFEENIENIFDICVIEGGGSPAEINLRKYDIVNMGMAETLDAPVVLVANIDIGGVFASIYGTVALLDEEDKKRIKGFIINKFRGDVSLLQSGIDMIEKKFSDEGYDIKCLGVIPYMDIDLEEEDSLFHKKISKKNPEIVVSVIKTKKMSNFTDFYCFNQYDDVDIKYIENASDLGNEDMIIIPGSKSTLYDLQWMKKNGIFERVLEEYKKGKVICAICGGMQMCGRKIYDKFKLESDIEEIDGFNFFEYETKIEKEKLTKQIKITIPKLNGILSCLEGIEINGYEIHNGVSNVKFPILSSGNIFVTYIHGIFDNDKFRNEIINLLREKKGLERKKYSNSFNNYKDEQYNKLAEKIQNNIDMKKIYKILEKNL